MTSYCPQTIYVDPSYKVYYQDRLFDQTNKVLNRDDTLAPFIRLKNTLAQQQISVHTADYLLQQQDRGKCCDYYSFGVLENYPQLKDRGNINLQAFVIFEPPIVAPHLYRALPELTSAFDRVYVHNVIGDGYSLHGVDSSKLRQLFWPQPFNGVLESYWGNDDRLHRIVVINGNHKPQQRRGELYSRRIEAMAALADLGVVDLYGIGWDKWWSRCSLWLPYWVHRRKLLSIYHGTCISKLETLSRFRFCLCFENMQMTGYVTEKLFDCLYAGTVPLYLGAPDIASLIPAETYIDCRLFDSWEEMWRAISKMTLGQVNAIRAAGREYLQSEEFSRYYDSLIAIVESNGGMGDVTNPDSLNR